MTKRGGVMDVEEIKKIAEKMKANAGSAMLVYDKTDHEYHSLKAVSVDELHDFANAILEVIEDDGDDP